MNTEVEIGVQVIEWFKELTGFNTTEFLEYMNKNNVWDILNDRSVVEGCIGITLRRKIDSSLVDPTGLIGVFSGHRVARMLFFDKIYAGKSCKNNI